MRETAALSLREDRMVQVSARSVPPKRATVFTSSRDRSPWPAAYNEGKGIPSIGGVTAAVTTQVVLADQTERERVIRWRVEQLAKIGYSWPAAMVIAANTHVDLHRAVDLVRRGCCPDVAVRILL
jgi:hypothetical protein